VRWLSKLLQHKEEEKAGEQIIMRTVIRSWIINTLHIKYYDEKQENERGGTRIISLTKCNSGTIQKLPIWI
jgi:hypothetical protein